MRRHAANWNGSHAVSAPGTLSMALRVIEKACGNGWSTRQISEAAGLPWNAVDRMLHGKEPRPRVIESLMRFAPLAGSPPQV